MAAFRSLEDFAAMPFDQLRAELRGGGALAGGVAPPRRRPPGSVPAARGGLPAPSGRAPSTARGPASSGGRGAAEVGDYAEDADLSYEALLELDEGVVGRGLDARELRALRRVRATREVIAAGDPCVALPCNCQGVLFQESAALKWLETHRTCPVCRWEFPG